MGFYLRLETDYRSKSPEERAPPSGVRHLRRHAPVGSGHGRVIAYAVISALALLSAGAATLVGRSRPTTIAAAPVSDPVTTGSLTSGSDVALKR
jgi:hypothetical protein